MPIRPAAALSTARKILEAAMPTGYTVTETMVQLAASVIQSDVSTDESRQRYEPDAGNVVQFKKGVV